MEIYEPNSDIERRIVTYMIVSTDFLKSVDRLIDFEYFETSYASIVAGWCLGYFRKYEKAPGKDVQEIFKDNITKLKDSQSDNVASFLQKISNEYEDEKDVNVDYILDKAILYFKERAIRIASDKAKKLLSAGDIMGAEACFLNFRDVSKTTSKWVNPFDLNTASLAMSLEEESLFSLPGIVGDFLIGPLQREWLMAFLGPMKRGKSWWLQEVAVEAFLNRKRVAFISLEMNERSVLKRIYKRMTGMLEKDTDTISFPVFDCDLTKKGECLIFRKHSLGTTGRKEGSKNDFLPQTHTKVCPRVNKCQNASLRVVFSQRKAKRFELPFLMKFLRGFGYTYPNNHLRLRTYPAYSANVKDIKRDLMILENLEGFIPDVIVVDYADILAPENPNVEGRDRYDETWKMLKNMASERHCLVVTASQSNRKSIEKKVVTQVDTAEDIRKLAHVDIMLSLNQTREEKESGVMRLGVVAHRHKDFNELQGVAVLQSLEAGQPLLDSGFLE